MTIIFKRKKKINNYYNMKTKKIDKYKVAGIEKHNKKKWKMNVLLKLK